MAWNINSAKLIIEIVDDSTGEIITREATLGDFKEVTAKKSTSTRTKKPKDDGDPTPKLTLLEGKIQMNKAAIDLTEFEPEMKIDIKFEKKGRITTPIMMQADSGNRLTKTYTISCRGSKHDNLAEYGDIFELIPYEEKDGYFKLKGNAPEKEDDIIDVPEEITDPNEDISDDEGIDIDDFDLDLDD